MNQKIYSCYIPNKVNNPYADNTRRIMKEYGIETYSLKECLLSPPKFFRCKVFNFNWFEKVSNRKEYLVRASLILFLKLCGKKIIYTLHNKEPHDIAGNDYGKKMMKLLCKKANRIVGLCNETVSIVEGIDSNAVDKIDIVPHPNYLYTYRYNDQRNLKKKYKFNDDDLILLFLGAVSPYKNLDILINAFSTVNNSKIKLLIAGKPSDASYLQKLNELAKGNSSIIMDLRFIPDDEIKQIYNTADIIVLPYNKKSSLNSGAVYLSFSLRKTVICPDIGTIDYLEDKSFVYSYSYNDNEDHLEQLIEVLKKVNSEYELSPSIISDKGEKAFEYVATIHSDDVIGQKYADIYGKLIK